jgi:ribosomal protein S18 acetylase RimI-like enzyme
VIIRTARFADRSAITDVLLHSGVFGRSDADCVDDMFTETWLHPRQDSYQWLVAAKDDVVQGFACLGPESLTKHTWDLFWICLRTDVRGRGVGRMLITEAVQRAAAAGGKVMVIYTSSNPGYAPARRLYAGAGFTVTSEVPDYYDDGDHLLIFWRRL